jgi:hypothetical protein
MESDTTDLAPVPIRRRLPRALSVTGALLIAGGLVGGMIAFVSQFRAVARFMESGPHVTPKDLQDAAIGHLGAFGLATLAAIAGTVLLLAALVVSARGERRTSQSGRRSRASYS